MKKLSVVLLLVCFGVVPIFLQGQEKKVAHQVKIEIPEVALLGIVSDGDMQVNFPVLAPNEAGSPVELTLANQNSNGIWLNYSSVICSKNHRRHVMASIQGGELPRGIRLYVEASESFGSGKGLLGKPVGKVALSGQATEVISDIGSCFTGKGVNNGHLLSYKMESDNQEQDISALIKGETNLQVVYTLTDCD